MDRIRVAFLIGAFLLQPLAGFAQTEALELPGPEAQGKISLDIKGMDVVDVLKMLAQRAGLNVAIGKNVTGRVTLFLKDVDVWDAFEIAVLANDLAYEKKADIINVMTQRDYELIYGARFQDIKRGKVVQLKYAKAMDISRALTQIKTNLGRVVVDEGSNTLALIDNPGKLAEMEDFIRQADLPTETRIFPLSYGTAEKLQPKLQEAITRGVGSIRIDERTNKIAITDFPQKLDELAKIITAFDEKTPQVLIDAQVIELTPQDKFEMGIDWDYWFIKNIRLFQDLPSTNTANLLKAGTIAKGAAITGTGQYSVLLDALRTLGDTKILSSPRIMALNNQEAKILVGTKEAYVTSSISQGSSGQTVTSPTVSFVDVGLKLYVTPTISRDGFVTMKIKPEISSATYKSLTSGGTATQVPIVATSEAETTVTVKDGITVVIGGLKKDKREKSSRRIPFLGDIPILGYFFGTTTDDVTKTELVILLTPHVMTGERSYTDFTEILPKDGARAKMVKGQIITEKIVSQEPSEAAAWGAGFREYSKILLAKINAMTLISDHKGAKGKIRVAFTLARDGSLIGEPMILEAENSRLAPFAMEAIKSASPFAPFPPSMVKGREDFSITLNYQ